MMKSIPLLQLSVILGLGLGLSACQTVSDVGSGIGDAASNTASAVGDAVSYLDPTTWFGDDTPAPTASADTGASTTPDLANLPAKPATASPAQQQAAAQSLAADGAQARYSADALRAGTESAAPPPSAADIPPSAQIAANAPPSAQAPSPPPSAQPAPPTAAPAPPPSAASAPPPSAALTQGTAAVPTGPIQTASVAPSTRPPGAEPAVPAVPANTPVRGAGAMSPQVASDAALGFRPSSAPPLNASITQWVSPPIVQRYRQTASNAGVAAAAVPAVPPKGGAVSGMTDGAVMANLDAVSTGPAGSISASNGGVAPTAVIYFPGDGTTLSAAARTQIKNAVAQYKAAGGAAAVRVVGHASSRTANMPVEKHLEVIFDKSQQRANAVAQELIHEGIPADKLLVEAVGDSQPVYYESMPQGEEGNRRAEIFVQS